MSNFNSDRALQTSADAYKLARQLNCAQLQLEALHLLVNLDKINSQKNAREYIRLFDSIQFSERQIQTKCARIAFNTDELAKEKEAAIEQARVVAGSSIVAILTLLLITIIIRQALQQRQLVLAKRQIVANKEVYKNIADQKMAIDQLRRAEESRIAAGLSTGIINRLRQTQKNLLILEEKTDHETIDRCQQYIDDLQNIEKEVRNVSHDLNHEMFSANSSFNTILDQLTDSFQNKPAAIFKEIEESVNWDVMESAVKMNLHIILQKLLKNISKYSVPRHIFVTITSNGGILQMIILEDGNGYSQKRAHGRADTKNIFERVTSRNGNIDIQTRVGKGTTIIVNLPLRSL
jgi:signal transduction histidine kinase